MLAHFFCLVVLVSLAMQHAAQLCDRLLLLDTAIARLVGLVLLRRLGAAPLRRLPAVSSAPCAARLARDALFFRHVHAQAQQERLWAREVAWPCNFL